MLEKLGCVLVNEPRGMREKQSSSLRCSGVEAHLRGDGLVVNWRGESQWWWVGGDNPSQRISTECSVPYLTQSILRHSDSWHPVVMLHDRGQKQGTM